VHCFGVRHTHSPGSSFDDRLNLGFDDSDTRQDIHCNRLLRKLYQSMLRWFLNRKNRSTQGTIESIMTELFYLRKNFKNIDRLLADRSVSIVKLAAAGNLRESEDKR
jgi:hypothetical protein